MCGVRERQFQCNEDMSIPARNKRGHGMFGSAGTSLSTPEYTMWRVEFDGGCQL